MKGDAEKGFQDAEVTVEGEFNYPFGSCSAIEPHGTIAWFHEDGLIEIWSSSICPFVIRDEVARVYNRPISEVRVHIPELGGCFGYKSDITVEQTIAYIASFVPGRPVKWVATRKEDLISTLIGHGIRAKMKIGAKKDGTLTAIKATLYHSTGAYADTGIHVCIGATHNCTGPYEFPNCFLESYLTYTNTPPVGAFRGYGHQEGQFAAERLMDMLARKLKMSPFELREKNYLGEGKITSLGERMWKTNGDVRPCVENVRKAVFEKAKPAGRRQVLLRPRLRRGHEIAQGRALFLQVLLPEDEPRRQRLHQHGRRRGGAGAAQRGPAGRGGGPQDPARADPGLHARSTPSSRPGSGRPSARCSPRRAGARSSAPPRRPSPCSSGPPPRCSSATRTCWTTTASTCSSNPTPASAWRCRG